MHVISETEVKRNTLSENAGILERTLCSLDYYDRLVSTRLASIDNTLVNIIFGYFGWQFNRAANVLFWILISVVFGYNMPESIIKGIELDHTNVVRTFNIHSDNSLKIRVSIFLFLYGCLSILFQTFVVT